MIMMERIHIKTKHVALALTIIFILAVLPILFVGIYDYPCADDYSYAAATRKVWLESHSVFRVLKEAAATSANRYITWQGTFTSIFFMALQPAVWTGKAYAVTPLIMVGILSVSVFYLIHTITVTGLKGRKEESTILSLLILLAVIERMVDRREAFFWYNGSVHYIVPFSCLLLMNGAIIAFLLEPQKGKKSKLILACVCALLVGGGNYVSGLIACVCGGSFLLLFFREEFRKYKAVCIPIAVLFISFLINMAAPGNFVRGETVSGMPPFKAILTSFHYTLTLCVNEWTDWTICALVLAAVPFLWKIVKHTAFRFPCPILVVAYSYCLVSAAFTPSLYAAGNVFAGRIQNIIFILYVLLLFLNVGYCMGWVCHYFHLDHEDGETRENLTKNQKLYVIFLTLSIFFGLGLTLKPEPDYYTSSEVVMSLVSGEAQAFAKEMEQRMELLALPKDDIILPPIEAQPRFLHHSDITDNPEDWSNAAMSRYYQKNSIVLSK